MSWRQLRQVMDVCCSELPTTDQIALRRNTSTSRLTIGRSASYWRLRRRVLRSSARRKTTGSRHLSPQNFSWSLSNQRVFTQPRWKAVTPQGAIDETALPVNPSPRPLSPTGPRRLLARARSDRGGPRSSACSGGQERAIQSRTSGERRYGPTGLGLRWPSPPLSAGRGRQNHCPGPLCWLTALSPSPSRCGYLPAPAFGDSA